MFFPAVHFIIYSQIGVTMTLLIVSDIHNHSTNCALSTRFRNCFVPHCLNAYM